MTAYYNEHDANAARWLRVLIERGHIAPGVVDERSIVDVRPDDIRGYTQCHFFAGIGGWSHALRLAGWPDNRFVWTGSCPCQPFSVAGEQRGSADERHLWPAFFRLIRECRPATLFGEQVAGSAGLAWLDHVCADLEDDGYAVAAADMCAAGVGAPHIRSRLWFVAELVAHPEIKRQRSDRSGPDSGKGVELAGPEARSNSGDDGAVGRLADDDDAGCCVERRGELLDPERPALGDDADRRGADGGMGDANGNGLRGGRRAEQPEPDKSSDGPVQHFWSDCDWLWCRDEKYRPVEPGAFPLVDGLPAGLVRGGDRGMAPDANASAEGRVMRLRGYGNAIVAPLAAAFIQAYEAR